jgi:hypothetical protein
MALLERRSGLWRKEEGKNKKQGAIRKRKVKRKKLTITLFQVIVNFFSYLYNLRNLRAILTPSIA